MFPRVTFEYGQRSLALIISSRAPAGEMVGAWRSRETSESEATVVAWTDADPGSDPRAACVEVAAAGDAEQRRLEAGCESDCPVGVGDTVEASEGIAAVDVPGRAGDEPCLGPR
jgi:hypothetical protein